MSIFLLILVLSHFLNSWRSGPCWLYRRLQLKLLLWTYNILVPERFLHLPIGEYHLELAMFLAIQEISLFLHIICPESRPEPLFQAIHVKALRNLPVLKVVFRESLVRLFGNIPVRVKCHLISLNDSVFVWSVNYIALWSGFYSRAVSQAQLKEGLTSSAVFHVVFALAVHVVTDEIALIFLTVLVKELPVSVSISFAILPCVEVSIFEKELSLAVFEPVQHLAFIVALLIALLCVIYLLVIFLHLIYSFIQLLWNLADVGWLDRHTLSLALKVKIFINRNLHDAFFVTKCQRDFKSFELLIKHEAILDAEQGNIKISQVFDEPAVYDVKNGVRGVENGEWIAVTKFFVILWLHFENHLVLVLQHNSCREILCLMIKFQYGLNHLFGISFLKCKRF